MTERNLGQVMHYWIGEVADVQDPHQSGRVRVRIYGRHDDRTNIPDSDLPWSQVMQPVTSAANGRIGTAPVGLVVRSKVIGIWLDRDHQIPLIIGTVGRAGDPIAGQTEGGAPAINIETGSIPPFTQGVPSNPYTRQYSNRVPISSIDAGFANITSVNRNNGGNLPNLVQRGMSQYTLPTVGSQRYQRGVDVLDVVTASDPLGTLASLPCLNNNLLSINSILRFVSGLIAGLTALLAQAIRNALLELARKIGLFKLLGMLNAAIANVKAIANLINALNIRICGVNLINQGVFDTTNYVLANVIGGLNATVGTIVGGLNTVINTATGAVLAGGNALNATTVNALDGLLRSVPGVPAAAVATATSRRPQEALIAQNPPPGYIQQYYPISRDPYPGYIEWRSPTSNSGTGNSIFTLRNGQPNFLNAQQHTLYAAQDHFTRTIGSTLLSGRPLTFDTLVSAVSKSVNFTQSFALSRALGAGASTASIIGVAAALIPTIVNGIDSTYRPNISQARYTAGSTSQPTNDFLRQQTLLGSMQQKMRVGLYNP